MDNNLSIFNVLAILGALAWLPSIIVWIKNIFIKPKISIICGSELEVGYTTFGPIINPQLAFISEKKKALINKIEVELTHENNDTQKFTWDWFEETLYTVDIPDAGQFPTKKNQKAIAINLQKDELIEKKIGFQQNTFKLEKKNLNQKAIEDLNNLSKAGESNDKILSMRSYNDLLDHYQHSFNWKIGKYKVVFKVFIKSKDKPFSKEISFIITPLEINNLENNIELCKSDINQSLVKSDYEKINWDWITPTIIE